MNCKKVKSLINGYIDNELHEQLREKVKRHLDICDKCNRLKENLKKIAVDPLESAERVKAPEIIWHKIKSAIEAQSQKKPIFDFSKLWLFPQLIRKPAFVLTTAMAVMIIAALITRLYSSPVNIFLAEQAQFISELAQNGQEYDFANGEINLGTTIEQYFL